MPQWSISQVLALAPDEASAKAGQGLARPLKWTELGQSENALWGVFQGSGKEPYRCRVDLSEPAFKCSCPSRKFPCKHGLGLLLILVEQPNSISRSEPPDWVSDWLTQRAKRQETKAVASEAPREVDAEAQAKRAAKRKARVEEGVEELSLWLQDLVRQGLAAAQVQPLSYWESMAARLVDAQAPGLAGHVRRLSQTATSGEGWQERMLTAVGRLHLLCEAFRRMDALPSEVQADVRAAVGFVVPKEELLKLPRQADQWRVMAQRVEQEEQLRVYRTWLIGAGSGRPALILQFAAGSQGFEQSFRTGTQFAAEVIYFPGAVPLRAMLVGERVEPTGPPNPMRRAPDIQEALREYAGVLARQPWIEIWPMRIGGLFPGVSDHFGRLVLNDERGRSLPILENFDGAWHLLAISGDHPIEVFGEWDGRALRPLSASCNGMHFAFSRSDAATLLTRVA